MGSVVEFSLPNDKAIQASVPGAQHYRDPHKMAYFTENETEWLLAASLRWGELCEGAPFYATTAENKLCALLERFTTEG